MTEPLHTEGPVSSRLDSDKPTFISAFGRKGSGKSVLARRLWDTWPRDGICIDPTGDALKPEDVQDSLSEVPDRWPEPRHEEEPVRIRFKPNMKSATYLDDMDRAVGLAARNRGCLLWIDEIGVVNQANRTRPYMRHLLNQGRHDRTSAIFCGPRPMTIDPLVLAQSDLVYVFELPNPADVKRIADSCGINPAVLDEAIHGLGKHEYVRWDGAELVAFPPLPLARPRRSFPRHSPDVGER